jgi:hypothetical protein
MIRAPWSVEERRNLLLAGSKLPERLGTSSEGVPKRSGTGGTGPKGALGGG